MDRASRFDILLLVVFSLAAGVQGQTASVQASPKQAPPNQPPPVAELRDGRWQPVVQPAAPAPPDAELERINQLLSTGHDTDARKHLAQWVRSHSNKAPHRDLALLLFAQVYDQLDDRIRAFYYCDELMDEYPESALFYPALEMQYRIADDYLSGHKGKFLGLPLVSETDEAVEMMYRIQQRSPGSPLAEKALLRTADYFYADRDYDLAHDAYGRYVKNYPRSPLVATVRLRQAFSSLAQFRGVLFDPTNILDARAQLLDLMTAYPALAREEDLGAIVRAIDDTLSAKLLATGDYYQRVHAPLSAVYAYRYLILTYPSAPQTPTARAALERMPQWALNSPPPLAGEQYMPVKSSGPGDQLSNQ